jgi:hypothetical protein
LTIAGKEIAIRPGNLSLGDALLIEEMYGKTIDEWTVDIQKNNLRAAAVGVLVLAQREDKTISLEDVKALDLKVLFQTLAASVSQENEGTGRSPTEEESSVL